MHKQLRAGSHVAFMEKTKGSSCILELEGKIDDMSSDDVEWKMEELLSGEFKKIILDLSKVEYVSSAGIRVLIIAYKKSIKAGKKVIIEQMSGRVRAILETVGILSLFSAK